MWVRKEAAVLLLLSASIFMERLPLTLAGLVPIFLFYINMKKKASVWFKKKKKKTKGLWSEPCRALMAFRLFNRLKLLPLLSPFLI